METYRLNLEKSELHWQASRVEGTTHNGTIAITSGELAIDGGKVQGGTFALDMTSIENKDLSPKMKGVLETHLKSADFFNVEAFPTATFTITAVEGGTITGDLTVKDATHPLSFQAKMDIGSTTALATATFEIDRTLWGIRFRSGKFFKDLGDKIIRDEILFTISIVAEKA